MTLFCAPRGAQVLRVHSGKLPSALAVSTVFLSCGCHRPEVHGEQCPLVFFRSRMYMSPLSNSPGTVAVVDLRLGGARDHEERWGLQLGAWTGNPTIVRGNLSERARSRRMPLKSYILTV